MPELYLPDARNWIDAYEAGDRQRMTREKTAGTKRAGGLMASGDYKGAAAELYGLGDFSGGSGVQRMGQEQGERDTRKSVLSQLDDNPEGAQAAAFDSGDGDLISTVTAYRDSVSEQEAEQAAADADRVAKIHLGALSVPQAQRSAYYQSRGVPPEALGESDFSDAMIEGSLASLMSVADTLRMRDQRADNDRADRTAAEGARHNRSMEGVASSNAARGWAAHKARQGAGGYGTPGVGQAPITDDDVEVDP